jgi:hypothetical protein
VCTVFLFEYTHLKTLSLEHDVIGSLEDTVVVETQIHVPGVGRLKLGVMIRCQLFFEHTSRIRTVILYTGAMCVWHHFTTSPPWL